MNKRVGILIALTAFTVAGAAYAADVAGQIKARKDFFHTIGHSMKGLSDELKQPTPSTADIQKYAATLDTQAPLLPGYFPAGTGSDSGEKTGAKPEIWQKPADFKADASAFATAAHKLNLAAQSNDTAAIRAATSALGSTCKACHEAFRKDDH